MMDLKACEAYNFIKERAVNFLLKLVCYIHYRFVQLDNSIVVQLFLPFYSHVRFLIFRYVVQGY